MSKQQKIIRRLRYFSVAGIVMTIALWSISTLYNYFHNSQRTLNKYDVGLNQLAFHNPEVNWLTDQKLEAEINKYSRKQFTDAYIDAWGILNLSMRYQEDLGLSESWSEKKVQYFRSQLGSKDSILRNDIVHNLQLNFISYDKKILSLTDKDVIVETSIKNDDGAVSFRDTSDYNIIMVISDSRWKIDKIIRI